MAGILLLAARFSVADELPLKRVVLFSSGVGYFQRDGEVNGNTTVELSFKADQINDLLKSLVLEDLGGGKIAPVVYASRDPITRALKSFAVDLTDNPPLGELLNRLRGMKAEIAAPKELTGVIVGVERQQQKVKDEVMEIAVLTVLTDQGLRAVPLDQVQQIRLLNAEVDAELRKALEVLAASHDTQRKPVMLSFTGQGKRVVRAGYILETPVWKTSYRLGLEEKKPPFLQGWAIVENTTDEDWHGISLTLVSGRPISFIQDLYQPLYAARPTVEPEIYSGLRPQVYEGGVEEQRALAERAEKKQVLDRRRALPAAGPMPEAAPAQEAALMGAARASAFGFVGRGVSAMAAAGAVGELFQYAIDQAVTVPRQKSAMLPIVNGPVEAEKVSIYNESVQRKFPLNGLRLKNTTGLHLMQGPITVFDGGVYAGDARIEDLQPKEERLISYAMDLAVEIEPLQKAGTNEVTSVRIIKGAMLVSQRYLQEKTYTVKNKADKARTVLVEHPFQANWGLVSPEKPEERTPTVYRFRVAAEPGKSQKLDVKEEQQISQSVALASADVSNILIYVRSRAISPRVKEALEKVVGMKNRLNEISRQRGQFEQQINELGQEQSRIRENMRVLPPQSELYGRYVKKFDEQETQIEGWRQQIRNLRTEEETQRRQLEEYLSGLQLE